jgi:hypothetical protein
MAEDHDRDPDISVTVATRRKKCLQLFLIADIPNKNRQLSLFNALSSRANGSAENEPGGDDANHVHQ